MNPKMTSTDAATCLGKNKTWVASALQKARLDYSKVNNQVYFGHETARQFFRFPFTPQVIVFQIVKGGTGKTSLVYEFAIRASLYGAKVLCVDMDQQGNLTHAFNQNAEDLPVMIDVLVDNVPLKDSIIPVAPGIDLLPSRFENATLDEVLRLKKLPLEKVYREPFQELKSEYDLIIVDCPPSLGQSVAACALASDYVISPVTPEKFALSGLEMARQSIDELRLSFGIPIQFKVLLNKYEARTTMSQIALKQLLKSPQYEGQLLKNYIRLSQDFPKAISNGGSIFDVIKSTTAKEDVDAVTQELMGILKLDTSEIIRTSLSESILSSRPSQQTQKHALKYIDM
jgi:chromosome partitioning protein